jgi:hypothetical protein
MVLSRDEKAFKGMLEETREQLKRMEGSCPHVIITTGTGQGARCEICGKHFGWLCPESPDRVCHYEARKIQGIHVRYWSWIGIHGMRHELPKEKVEKYIRPIKDETYYDDEDCCIFCGHPEERK